MSSSAEHPQIHRKITLSLGIAAGIFTVAFISFIFWAERQLRHELSQPRHFGALSIHPVGFHSRGWMSWGWEELQLFYPDGTAILYRPALEIRPSRSRGFPAPFHLFCDSARIEYHPISQKREPSPREHVALPDWRIPIRVSAFIPRLRLEYGDYSWTADSIAIRNIGQNRLALSWGTLNGYRLPSPVRGDLGISSIRGLFELRARGHARKDSFFVTAKAPSQQIESMALSAAIYSEKPSIWLPGNTLPVVRKISRLDLRAEIRADWLRRQLKYSAEAQFVSDSIGQIPTLQHSVRFSGDENLEISAQILAKSNANQSASFHINAQGPRHAEVSGYIQNFSVHLGSFLLPADLNLEYAVLRGQSLRLNAQTKAGSRVAVQIPDIHRLKQASFQIHATSGEPWIETWCKGKLRIAPPSTIEGVYHDGLLTGKVRTGIAEAYHTTAELFETTVSLDSSGVYLRDGRFVTRGIEHLFHGEVVWHPSRPHVQFEIVQNGSGIARIYHNLNGDMNLHVSQLPLEKLPLKTPLPAYLNGLVTGNWEHHFETNQGRLLLAWETQFRNRPLSLFIQARQENQLILIDSAQAHSLGNRLSARALLNIHGESKPSVSIEQAEVHSDSFALPAILQLFGDSSLLDGTLRGTMRYHVSEGLKGQVTADHLIFGRPFSDRFSASRVKLIAAGQNLQVSARIRTGQDIFWNSEAELNIARIFAPEKQIALALVMDHGGVAWADGFLDSARVWRGNIHIEGPWLLSRKGTEIKTSSLDARILFDTQKKLQGVSGVFRLDTLTVAGHSFLIPLRAHGLIRNEQIFLDTILVYGENQTDLRGQLSLRLSPLQVEQLDLYSPRLDLTFDQNHRLTFRNLRAQARTESHLLQFHVIAPGISYKMNTPNHQGRAAAELEGVLDYSMPLGTTDHLYNPRLTGTLLAHKFYYDRQLNVLDVGYLKSLLANSSRFWGSREKNRAKEYSAPAAGQPTELDIRILDSGRDVLKLNTSLATFPFTIDLHLLGTVEKPVLDGDLNAVGHGFIGLEGFETLELQSLRLWWPGVEPLKGEIRLQAEKSFPFCASEPSARQETCRIGVQISGPLSAPVPQPSADCGIEATPAQIYYSVLIGCVAENMDNNLDKNELAGKLLSRLMTEGINQGLGGQYVGDIGLKYRFLDESTLDERDSNYIRVPFKLDRWVKNLSLQVAYSQDRSQHPRYDQSYELGLAYSLPLQDSADTAFNHINPTLDFSGQLTARRYPATETQNESDNRVEKSLGISYSWSFWDFGGRKDSARGDKP